MRRRIPEVKSPFDSSTTVSCKCSIYTTYLDRLKVAPSFLIFDYGGMSISTVRGRLVLEVTSPVDSATWFSVRVLLSFTVYLVPFQRY
jgi:hypothetical protein